MSDRVISVVTALHPDRGEYLPDAGASLDAQELPDGWRVQWVIQQDGGPRGALPPGGSCVSYDVGRAGGPGMARTMALSRCEGELVRVLDADDMLPAGALARDIEVFATQQEVAWSTASFTKLWPSGQSEPMSDPGPFPGRIYRDEILRHWLSRGYDLPVHPATLCVRREILLALGGWMALPAGEDTGLLMALNVVRCGWFHQEPGLIHRKWPGSATAQPAHTDPVELAARRRVTAQRVLALRAWLRPDAPALLPQPALDVVQ